MSVSRDTMVDHDHHQARIGCGELSLYLNTITGKLPNEMHSKEEETRGDKDGWSFLSLDFAFFFCSRS